MSNFRNGLLTIFIFFISLNINSQEIVESIYEGNLSDVKSFVEDGRDLNKLYEFEYNDKTYRGYLISYAYSMGKQDIFEYLLQEIKKEPDFNVQTGSTLSLMIDKDDFSNVKRMASLGADINTVCHLCGYTFPVLKVLESENQEMIDYIFSLKPDVYVVDSVGLGVLHYSLLGGHFEIFKEFIEIKNIDIWSGHRDDNLLFYAAGSDDIRFIEYLYANMKDDDRYNINLSDSDGYFLLSAASASSKEIVKFILDKGANLNRTDRDGLNILHWAAYDGNSDVVKMLIEDYKMNPNKMSKNNESPMWMAMKGGDYATVEYLIKYYDGHHKRFMLKQTKKSNKEFYKEVKHLF